MSCLSFLKALQEGQLDEVREHLDTWADADVGWPNKPDYMPSPLHIAACRGHEAVGRLLLERGAEPNGANDRRKCAPPLYYACTDCDIRRACAMATLLLDFGAEVDATDDRGATPLISACHRPVYLSSDVEHVELATLLLDRGANIMKGDPHTPLWHAAYTGKVGVVELLLQRGAPADVGFDPSHPQRVSGDSLWTPLRQGTPLWYAVDAGKVQVVQKLLQHGAPADIGFDPSQPRRISGALDSWGMDAAFVTPLYHRLRKDGCRETVPIARLLLAHGASFDREHRVFDHTRPRDFYHVDTPLSLVRFFRTAQGMPEVNELFDAYLQHYWRLRVKLRLFGSLSEHLLDLHVAPFLIGDGVLKKRSG